MRQEKKSLYGTAKAASYGLGLLKLAFWDWRFLCPRLPRPAAPDEDQPTRVPPCRCRIQGP